MQSALIVGKDTEKLKEETQKIIAENNISKFDTEIIFNEKAIGIGNIRDLQKNIFLSPVNGDKKAVILETFSGIGQEAQNAFLKILEEPPASTIILVLVKSLDYILPTIISRCRVINVSPLKKLTDEKIKQNLKTLSEIKNGFSKGLVLAQNNSKDRETALNFLEEMIISVDENLDSVENAGKILKKFQNTYTIIKTNNVSPRFALENLFLNMLS